jgi:hypothetical protein
MPKVYGNFFNCFDDTMLDASIHEKSYAVLLLKVAFKSSWERNYITLVLNKNCMQRNRKNIMLYVYMQTISTNSSTHYTVYRNKQEHS